MSNTNIEKKVLALKYRPRRFEDLVGQSTISQTLSLALDSNRLSHAYLFSGLRGSGKTSTARIMAKAFLCSNGPTSKPCEVCENCQSANANRHLDIIEMDAASNRGIDDIKDLIEHTKYKPSSARFKVFIIDEVHMLTTQAFNALLKTLEEPPSFVKFILATTDPLKLPATILSRTQHFRFNKISNSDVIHHLSHILNEENIDYETEALEILARSGQGSLRDTLTLLDQAIIFSKGSINTIAVVEMLGLIEPKVMDKIFDIVLNRKDITSLVKSLENYEVSQICDEMTIYLKQKMLDKDAKFDLLLFDRFFRILGDSKHLLALNSDGSFVLILTLLKMQEATNLKSIQDIINQVEQIEVKPVVKEAISKEKIVEHAKNDENHIYEVTISNEKQVDDEKNIVESRLEQTKENFNLNEKVEESSITYDEYETVIDEPNVYDEVLSNNTLPLEVVDAVEFITPFDEEFNSFDFEKTSNQEPAKVEDTSKSLENFYEKVENTIKKANPFEEEQVDALDEAINENLKKEDDAYFNMYEKVINKVYDRDIKLGECFEDNFVYKSYENKKLQIISYAQGEERKFLFKHFGLLKTFIYDVFGSDIELDFIKDDSEEPSKKKIELEKVQEKEEIQEITSTEPENIEENLVGGSGCVASMYNNSNPTPAQQELQINDILNSKMLNKAKELFDIRKITVKTKT
ncbi:DNA polymerase III subunit gamma/tau [Malaciobacter mytili]|uniref:DNA polymerase III subunit gamma/tau n=1 Tax=Malaciobacter mytili TaxID=603050 RepID=UPI003A872CCE